jgi:tRNA nucleotidyltransferase (CCA-adding enzyme)
VIDTGIKYGTVSVMMAPGDINILEQSDDTFGLNELDAQIYEITTFRAESESRKPQSVRFTESLDEDLLRRDFTMNALAYNPSEGLVDLCGGLKDIENRIIRCVKDPKDRLSEDWLRIFRAIRFQAQLGFNIEENTKYWVNHLSSYVNEASAERIQAELNKIVQAEYCEKALLENVSAISNVIPELKMTVGCTQNNPHHKYDVYTHSVKTLGVLANQGIKDHKLGLAALLHDIGKPFSKTTESGVDHFYGHAESGAIMAKGLLRRLNYSNEVINDVFNLIKYHDFNVTNKSGIRRLLNVMGEKTFKRLLKLRYADIMAQSSYKIDKKLELYKKCNDWLDEIIKEDEAFKVSDLEISGRDLIKMGFKPGPQFKSILDNIMDLVMEDRISNTHSILVDYVIHHYTPDRV